MDLISNGLRKVSGNRLPLWNRWIPKGANRIKELKNERMNGSNDYSSIARKVVYFPSCINRSMGLSKYDRHEIQLTDKMQKLLKKAGYDVVFPERLNQLCCGMAFSSKGYKEAGMKKSMELEAALWKASEQGNYPILCDMSPCLYTMKENMEPKLKLYEPVEFILDHVIQHLDITPVDETVTIFPVCSMKKMEIDQKLADLAGMCAKQVIIQEANCCGFAGDRGFTHPELNKHGLRELKNQIPLNIQHGYSTSRTCEIGLSLHSGIRYKSIIYLVDRVSKPKDV
jgi:D-lactate dehydrogenase